MINKELTELEGHVQMLDKMSNMLFEMWADRASQVFKEKCIGTIKKEWREYMSQMTQYSNHLKQQIHELEMIEQNIKKVQDGKA